MTNEKKQRSGVIFATSAFVLWGILPLYFKAIAQYNPWDIVAHRIVWSFVFGILLLLATRQHRAIFSIARSPKIMFYLSITAVLICTNWLIFVDAVTSDRLLDASLGYYINPLMNMLLGFLILGERMRLLQSVAAALVILAVVIEIVKFGSVPWTALLLAFSFGVYGLLRKQIPVDAQTGLLVETTILLPLAVGYLWWGPNPSTDLLSDNIDSSLLLIMAGPLTMAPLILFTAGAKRLQLTSIGFIQYLAPSIMFVLALVYFNERVNLSKAITFGFIWCALALVTVDAIFWQKKWRRSAR